MCQVGLVLGWARLISQHPFLLQSYLRQNLKMALYALKGKKQRLSKRKNIQGTLTATREELFSGEFER